MKIYNYYLEIRVFKNKNLRDSATEKIKLIQHREKGRENDQR